MSAAETLRKARALIERPEAWTEEVMARDADGGDVAPRSAKAVCWCMRGAIEKVAPVKQVDAMLHRLRAVLPRRTPVTLFNDDPQTTHADVLAAFDRAIAAAELDAERRAGGGR